MTKCARLWRLPLCLRLCGLVDKDLTVEVVELLGKGLGTIIRRQHGRSIALGRDCRESSTRFRDALAKGLTSTPDRYPPTWMCSGSLTL